MTFNQRVPSSILGALTTASGPGCVGDFGDKVSPRPLLHRPNVRQKLLEQVPDSAQWFMNIRSKYNLHVEAGRLKVELEAIERRSAA